MIKEDGRSLREICEVTADAGDNERLYHSHLSPALRLVPPRMITLYQALILLKILNVPTLGMLIDAEPRRLRRMEKILKRLADLDTDELDSLAAQLGIKN